MKIKSESMERVIKFRAWDAAANRMILPEYADWEDFMIEPDGTVSYSFEAGLYETYRTKKRIDLKLMQFTGLLDKEGKEIYEGDIVKSKSGSLHEVKWINACFHLVQLNKQLRYGPRYYSLSPGVAKCKTILTNIYQSPELIK